MKRIETWIERILFEGGVALDAVPYLRMIILLAVLTIVAAILFFITKRVIIGSLYKIFKKTSFTWDDLIADHQAFNNLAHIVPAILVKIFAQIIFRDFEQILPLVITLTDTYLIIVGMLIILALLKVAEFALSKSSLFIDKPLASYFQLIRIIVYIATGVFFLSVILGKSPLYFLSAFGAMTAILLLIFKDTILGLVASVQIAANDMVRVGDWVEMPKFNADGDVLAINLNTVKVQNWDRTVTSVPTYYFITDSFKNWRGMQESGGRRIKRAFYINVRTIKFVDAETRERFKKYQLITDYLSQRQQEIELHNKENNIDTSALINGRRMTNIGVFRKYIEFYLKNHKYVHQGMIMMVRQLTPEDHGIPIEVYCFTATTDWVKYEEIQADIFDHLLAAATFFDLEVFQKPGGSDISAGINSLTQSART